MEPIGVVIVDDQLIARRGLMALLEDDTQVQVIGEGSDGQEALTLAAQHRRTVFLMDIKMPGMDGLEATRQIKAQFPDTAVIMLTNYDDDALVIDAVQAGADGFLLKDTSHDLLLHTVLAVANGGILIKASLLRSAMGKRQTSKRPIGPETSDGTPPTTVLTERERALMLLLAQGRTNKEIAETVGLAEVTIKNHVKTVVAKLQAVDRTHAVTIAMRLGIIT